MRVMGIDPGLAIVGYGVIDCDKRQCLTLIDFGTILTYPTDTTPERLRQVASGMRQLIEMYQPDAIAFEELFFNRNVTTGINVAMARGAALAMAADATDELYEYTPSQVKQAVTGYGRAEKKQVQMMICALLRLKEVPKPDDAADAVAVAICHAHSQGTSSILDTRIK